ncbi:MAG: hypothetical protein HOI53_09990 [Francisellaceae bacterium]|nr:hypothetical protein [Francisellaceae bacterium]MBT6208345.1 hypothetical protein [Francisellaceae bacterium]MBT6539486.1 hypothetical protein [Francisellaceae bacterium]
MSVSSLSTEKESVISNILDDDVVETLIEQEYVAVDKEHAAILAENKPILENFARGEHLSHGVPYDLAGSLAEGETKELTITDEDGIERQYVAKQLASTNAGLLPFILVGKDDDNPRIKVSFRGTDPGSYASVVRDLESYGAGHESFNKDKHLLLAQVFDVIKERADITGQKQKIEFSGHSLGGADAQNMTASFTEAYAKRLQEQRDAENSGISSRFKRAAKKLFSSCRKKSNLPSNSDALDHIESVQMHVANSAGVSKKTAKTFKKSLETINDPLYRDGIDVSMNFLMVEGDGVQQTGQTTVAADIPPEHANVNVLKIDKGHSIKHSKWWNPLIAINGLIGTGGAHTSKHFIGREDVPSDLSYTLMNNTENHAAVKSVLTHKSWFENSSVAYWIKRGLHGIMKPFSSCLKLPEEVKDLIADDKAVVLPSSVRLSLQAKKGRSRTTDDLDRSFVLDPQIRSDFLKQYGLRAIPPLETTANNCKADLSASCYAEAPSRLRARVN